MSNKKENSAIYFPNPIHPEKRKKNHSFLLNLPYSKSAFYSRTPSEPTYLEQSFQWKIYFKQNGLARPVEAARASYFRRFPAPRPGINGVSHCRQTIRDAGQSMIPQRRLRTLTAFCLGASSPKMANPDLLLGPRGIVAGNGDVRNEDGFFYW
ncbi:hypothetical protein CEXT_277121 [Caerostris extrusa]|uniref:Uncharacterized protein n=1 Tax=Caerostris extrusa TaxID=172846 RepID=A0AAV4MNZ5_CAEEX|nr:hypothetical protein CEXT_277121 [Caerostris extrusa]